MEHRLDGKVCLVTGAGRGIGRAIARRFAAAGGRLAILDRNSGDLTDVAEEIEGCLPVVCDVGDAAQVEAAIAEVARAFGRLDVLVNNAAAPTAYVAVPELSLAVWEETLRVNLTAAFLFCKYGIPLMRLHGGGAIINIASQLARVSAPRRAAYSATKGALVAFTKGLAIDHAAEGIRANTLSPGATMTQRLTERHGSEVRRRGGAGSPAPVGAGGAAGGDRRGRGLSCLRCGVLHDRRRPPDRWRIHRALSRDRSPHAEFARGAAPMRPRRALLPPYLFASWRFDDAELPLSVG